MSANNNEYKKMFGSICCDSVAMARCACVACNSCTCACSCHIIDSSNEIDWD